MAAPNSPPDNPEVEEELQEVPAGGLAGVLEQLRQRGTQSRGVDGVEAGIQDNEAFYIKEYLDAKLETVSCLRYWEKRENEVGAHPVRAALCRLARYTSSLYSNCFLNPLSLRKFLTPPPTSTDVERLFSVAGLIASDNRSRLSPETLEKLLFCRENILAFNFELDWD